MASNSVFKVQRGHKTNTRFPNHPMAEVECIGSWWTLYPLRKDWSNATPLAQTCLFIGPDGIEKWFWKIMIAATGLQGLPLLNWG